MATISFNDFLKEAGGKKTDVKLVSSTTPMGISTEKPQTFTQDLAGDIKGIGSDIKTSFTTRKAKVEEAKTAQRAGEQSGLSTFGQLFGQSAGLVSDSIGALFKGGVKAVLPQQVEDTIKQGLESAGKTVVSNNTIQNIITKYNSLDEKTKRNIDATLGVGSLVLDVTGVGLAGKPVKIATKTALTGLGETAAMAGSTLSATGKITKATGKTIAETAIRPTVQEAEKILTYEAKNTLAQRAKSAIKGEIIEGTPITRGTTAFEKGIAGTERSIGSQAKRESSNLWKNNIGPALKSSKEVVTKDELFAPVIERINAITDPMLKESYQDAFNAVKDAYKTSTKWTLEEAQKLKEDLARFVPEKVYKGKPIANELKQINADMADAIRQKIYNSLGNDVKKSYIDYGNLKKLEEIGVKAITEKGKLGGFGGFWTGLYDAALTPVKTVGGQVLYRVGNKLEFIGEKGLKTFNQFLKTKGYTIKK